VAGASISGDLDLRGTTLSGHLDLSAAAVQGDLDLLDTALGEEDRVSVHASGLTARRLNFAPVRRPGRVELEHSTVGVLADVRTSWPVQEGRSRVDRFTYQSLATA
jgi:hypothetical protein